MLGIILVTTLVIESSHTASSPDMGMGDYPDDITMPDRTTTCDAIPWLHECELNGYDRLTAPGYLLGNTTDVKIQIFVESVGNFKAATMDYDMDIYFIEFWRDFRLKHNHTSHLAFNDHNQLERLWMPDIYFANSKRAEYNYVTVPNYVLKVWPNGTLRFSVRVSMKVSCHMDLKAYPVDQQLCYLKIVTYGSTTDIVNVTWVSDAAIDVSDDITQADLKLVHHEAHYCDGSYFNMKFSCLMATFYLQRNVWYSLLQTYIPTSFIVIISWISFWIDPTSVPGRVGLAVTTLLTLSTQAIGLHYQLPPVSYAKAQDVWFGACLIFLFGALVEFALVNVYTRRGEVDWLKKRPSSPHVQILVPIGSNGVDEDSAYTPYVDSPYRRRALTIDRCSRMLFPALFFTFCVIYWCYYLTFIPRIF